MTGLELNYFRIINPNGTIFTDVTLDVGEYWATLTPTTSISLVDGITYSVVADGRINDNGTVKAIAAGTWAFTIAVPSTDYLYEESFNGTPYTIPHVLTQNQCISQFGWLNANTANEGNATLVDDPNGSGRGTVLKIDFYEGNYAKNKTAPGYIPHVTGLSAAIWAHAGKDELYFSYDIYVPSTFVYNFTMKNTRMQGGDFQANNDHVANGGKYCECGMGFEGENPLSTAFREEYGCSQRTTIDGELSVYQYYATDFQHFTPTGIPYTKGAWNTIEMYVKINTPHTASNGEFKVWKNGSLIVSRDNRQWRNSVDPTMQWDKVSLLFYEGGAKACWAAPQNQSLYVDNLIISENRITG